MAKAADKKILTQLRSRYKTATQADRPNRRKALDDMRFVYEPGAQWDELVKIERGERPCLEFNKLRVTIKRVVNDMRANRPAGKIRPVEDADVDSAEVYEGLVRNIWNVSDGDTVIDGAAEYQVGGGMGAWRVCVDYVSDADFDQEIYIEAIRNPFCLYSDPSATDSLKRDARYWFLTSRMAKSTFEAKYPKAAATDFEQDDGMDDEEDEDWEDDESVRLCEYWWKESTPKTLYLLSDGKTVDTLPELPQGVTVLKERSFMGSKILSCIASGSAILEGPTEWAGIEFPFVQIYGEQLMLEGDLVWFGLVRFAKDAQRAYNASRTAAVESIQLAPQAKWWATAEQAAGHTNEWAVAHQKNYPFMMYNPDSKAPGAPQRMGGADIPAALVQEMQISSEDIKAVTGIYDASLGQRSNETSGVAIRARQSQGEVATFNYMDNLSKGIRRTWEIFIDLIPKIYDTERAVRILGADGGEKYVKVNQIGVDQVGNPIIVNDLSRGRYDVTITTGPSYSTQRQEAAESYTQLSQANPLLFTAAGDLIMKSMDLPYADEIAERLKAMLPPQLQQLANGDGQQSPEVMQAMQQAQAAMEQVQQQGQLVQQAATEAQQLSQQAQTDKAAADQAQADVKLAVAQLQTQEAKLNEHYAQLQFNLLKQQQAMATGQQSQDVANDREVLAGQVQQALAEIQGQAAQFMAQSAALMHSWAEKTQTQVVVAPPVQTNKVVHVKRVNGELVGTIETVPQ
jgi:hypothetical protein